MTTLKAQREQEQAAAVQQLRDIFPPGTTVFTVLRHVSQSGMSRAISVIDPADVSDVSWLVARATGDKIDQRHGGIKVGGCGMDMGFHLVYNLSRVLYADGFHCTGMPRCPSNDHSNERTPDYRVGRRHSDPGYALQHRWI